MRNSERLDNFYAKLKEMHLKYFPGCFFAVLIERFLGYTDPFYFEEDKFLEVFEEFCKSDENIAGYLFELTEESRTDLDIFYQQLTDLHKKFLPDWRVGQLWVNLFRASADSNFSYSDKSFLDFVCGFIVKTTGISIMPLGADADNLIAVSSSINVVPDKKALLLEVVGKLNEIKNLLRIILF